MAVYAVVVNFKILFVSVSRKQKTGFQIYLLLIWVRNSYYSEICDLFDFLTDFLHYPLFRVGFKSNFNGFPRALLITIHWSLMGYFLSEEGEDYFC